MATSTDNKDAVNSTGVEAPPPQLSEEDLKTSDPECLKLLGSWVNDSKKIASIADSFVSADPYPHVVIDGFFDEKVAEEIEANFPAADAPDLWFQYKNPIEDKLACNVLAKLPELYRTLFRRLNAPEMVNVMSSLTKIENLEADPYIHGGGLHCHPPGGKLDMHLDYSIHPLSGRERRVNLIVFFNKDWKREYGGCTEFWNADYTKCKVRVVPKYNRAVLFQTSDLSYHGLPDPISCPPGMNRKSLALYYLSEPRKNATLRYKAHFFSRPFDAPSPFYDKLRELRPNRRILDADLVGWAEEQERLKKYEAEHAAELAAARAEVESEVVEI